MENPYQLDASQIEEPPSSFKGHAETSRTGIHSLGVDRRIGRTDRDHCSWCRGRLCRDVGDPRELSRKGLCPVGVWEARDSFRRNNLRSTQSTPRTQIRKRTMDDMALARSHVNQATAGRRHHRRSGNCPEHSLPTSVNHGLGLHHRASSFRF